MRDREREPVQVSTSAASVRCAMHGMVRRLSGRSVDARSAESRPVNAEVLRIGALAGNAKAANSSRAKAVNLNHAKGSNRVKGSNHAKVVNSNHVKGSNHAKDKVSHGPPSTRATGHALNGRSVPAKVDVRDSRGQGKIAAAKGRRVNVRASISHVLINRASINPVLTSHALTIHGLSDRRPPRLPGSIDHGLHALDSKRAGSGLRVDLRIGARVKGSGLAPARGRQDSLVANGRSSISRGLSGRRAIAGLDFRLKKCSQAKSSGRARAVQIVVARIVAAGGEAQIEAEIVGSGRAASALRVSIGSEAEVHAVASGNRAKAASGSNGRRGPRARGEAVHRVSVRRVAQHHALQAVRDVRAVEMRGVGRGVDRVELRADSESRDFVVSRAADRRDATADRSRAASVRLLC